MFQTEQILQDRYQLKQKLGQNAGQQTWLAEDLATEPRRAIIKLLAFGDQVQWDSLRLFEREAQVLRQLDHPQIPKYRDYFSIDDRILWFGLVQEYIPGTSLKDVLAQGRRFSEPGIHKIGTAVLQVLIYLHELSPPILHRDIKPSNLILSEDNQVYLVDFGAVQDRASAEGATFTVVGTYGYVPMEQFEGRAVPASDLYGLGATLIHLVTGTAPAHLPRKELRIQFSDRVSLKPSFVQWIETLTHPDVSQRFSTARQAMEALQSGLTGTSSRPTLSSSQPTSASLADMRPPADTCVKVSKSLEDELLIEIPSYYKNFPASSVQQDTSPFPLVTLGEVEHSENEIKFSVILVLVVLILAALFGINLELGIIVTMFTIPLLGLAIQRFYHQYRSRSEFVYLNRGSDRFAIYKAPFPSLPDEVYGFQGAISRIEDVFLDTLHENQQDRIDKYRVVTIQAGIKEYSFGKGLSRTECVWLVREIRDWLELK